MGAKRLGDYLDCPAAVLDEAAGAPRLGARLVEAGAITPEQLADALRRQRVDRLRACPLFDGIGERGLERVGEMVRERSLVPGELLFAQDGEGESFFVVVRGDLDVFRADDDGEPLLLATARAGETVGEMGYFSSGVRSASVRARTPAELLELSYEDLPRCLWIAPRLAVSFLDLVTRRLRETDLRYERELARARRRP